MKVFLIITACVLLIFGLIQFIPVNRVNPPLDKKQNFTDMMQTPEKITGLLRNACYDCHSNETNYPDYAYVAPISWSISHHVAEGREHGNFSEFGSYGKEARETFLQHSIQTIDNYSMPLPGYIAQHPQANLTDAERKLLTNYFQKILDSTNSK